MATEALKERVAALENELMQIKQELAAEGSHSTPAGWEKIFGSFANSEGFDEAVRLGREYREAQNVQGDETAD